jgi:hypothetical protein
MERTTLYLPSELHELLRDESRRTGQPQSAIVREALVAHLVPRRYPWPKSIGMGESDFQAKDIDEWLKANWRPD